MNSRLTNPIGFVVVATCSWFCGGLAANAQDNRLIYPESQTVDRPSSEYADLVRRLEATEAELQQLRSQIARPAPRADFTSAYGAVSSSEITRLPSIESRVDELEKAAADAKKPKYPNARLTGFFHYDTGYFTQDANSMATLGDIQDGSGFRRARLAATGSVAENINYMLEMDFAIAGRPSFVDLWGEATMVPVLGNVRIGQFRQPFSMDALTGIKNLTFLERSLPFQALVPFRRLGIMAYDHSDNEMTTWAYSVYRTGQRNMTPIGDTQEATNLTDNGDYSVSTRLTHLLWYDEPAEGRYMLHIGGAYNYSSIGVNPVTGTRVYRSFAIPEFFVGEITAPGNAANQRTPVFVDTGNIAADDFHLLGAELAGVYGSAYFQAEYMQTYVNQTAGPTLAFDGAYVETGYFLTGEHRPYDRAAGAFGRVKPFEDFFTYGNGFCGKGAWEIAFRWSYVNLNDGGINGGQLTNLTAGLNWYLNQYAKLQFIYIHAMLEDRTAVPSPPGQGDTDIYAARLQVEF